MLNKIKIKLVAIIRVIIFYYKQSGSFFSFIKRGYKYIRRNGFQFEYLLSGTIAHYNSDDASLEKSFKSHFFRRFPNLIPLPTINYPSELRVNVITDSLAENSIYGGVMTSLIFGILLSNKLKCPLRVITRDHASRAATLLEIAQSNEVTIKNTYELHNFSCEFQKNPTYRLPVSKNDIFIGTSWWNSAVAKEIKQRKQYIYVIQEDERIFYPNADEHVIINRMFNDKNMIPVINTKLLHEHFKINKCEYIANQGICFEPAFVGRNIKYEKRSEPGIKNRKFSLFFYSRPYMPRNLFYTGLELIDSAINLGILKAEDWDIFFAGQDGPEIISGDKIKPKYLGKLKWKDYLDFLSSVDLGISLMLAPTPSYPPLDLAVAGGVVLTNKYANKLDLSVYSKNIICSDLDMHSLLKNLEIAVELARNTKERAHNFAKNNILDDWEKAFSPVLDKVIHQVTSF